ncbi:MAG: hypothetical protein HY897_22850 [Deltaproteobacteria bacterium]|nr:hypothetical protein [Deltaproteobacteria bacterium]
MLFRGTVVVAAVLLACSIAWAADEGKKTSAPEEVSEGEMLKKSTELKKQGLEVVKFVLELLNVARQEKDIQKVNCVNEKLTAAKALLLITERADIALQEHIVKKEIASARHEYEKINIAKEKLKMLRSEAQACTGQLTYTGETKVDIEEPKDEKAPPQPKTTQAWWDKLWETTGLDRPPSASPYM